MWHGRLAHASLREAWARRPCHRNEMTLSAVETPISHAKPGEIVVRLEDVRKTYLMGSEVVRALAGVSINFERGSFWALMGASGSGKSTLLNLLGCLDRPTS